MDLIKMYTEVFEVLNLLGNEYIQKIPIQLYNHINNNRDKKSIIEYNINTNILEQNIRGKRYDCLFELTILVYRRRKTKIIKKI